MSEQLGKRKRADHKWITADERERVGGGGGGGQPGRETKKGRQRGERGGGGGGGGGKQRKRDIYRQGTNQSKLSLLQPQKANMTETANAL